MVRRGDLPSRWKKKAAIGVIVSLALMVPTVEALWGQLMVPRGTQAHSIEEKPFPMLEIDDTLRVVPVGEDVDFPSRLTLLSLQGMVNSEKVRIYLDFSQEALDESSILNFISSRHSLPYEIVSVDDVIAEYLSLAKGLFVFDPTRPESINIGTMFASARKWVIVGQEGATEMSEQGRIPIALDYSQSDWARLTSLEAYDRAMAELYPHLTGNLLAILPPERLAIRDYLIAADVFVFYHTQGALASPQELAATYRILHGTPRGIPVLGWFNSLTETEENLFVQMLSHEGKYLVGGYNVTNLSVLTALGRNQTYRQVRGADPVPPLENKIYTVLSVADGDNLDYVSERMREFWDGPVRGSVPIAWSLNPLLIDLAPPYMEYYYTTAGFQDRFIASPSGAGYLYPDFLLDGDLEPFLKRSAQYLGDADMDVVWLLNSFPAKEVAYSDHGLSQYVKHLKPRGLVLDYADAPVTRAAWVQKGDDFATPVVRGTHLWTTKANFLAKVQSMVDSSGSGPQFLWITVYPWRFNLTDGMDVVSELRLRTQDTIELVSVDAFFALLQQDFVRRATSQLESMRSDPLVTVLGGPQLDEAGRHASTATLLQESGDLERGSYEAFLAVEDLQSANLLKQVFLMALIVAAITSLTAFLSWRRKRGRESLGALSSHPLAEAALLFGVAALFLVALRVALDANFWTYHFLLIGMVASGAATWLSHVPNHPLPRFALPLSTGGFVVSTVTVFLSPAAFPLSMVLAVFVVTRILPGLQRTPKIMIPATSAGLVLGFLIPLQPYAVALFGTAFLGLTLRLKQAPSVTTPSGKGWIAGAALSLTILALAPFHYNSLRLKLQLEGESLAVLGVSVLLLSAILAFTLTRLAPQIRPMTWIWMASASVALSSIGFVFLGDATVTTLLFFASISGLGIIALSAVTSHSANGGQLSEIIRPFLSGTVLLLLFMRMPPLSYSLLFATLPEPLEYVLYMPHIVLAAVGVGVLVSVLLTHLLQIGRGLPEKAM